MTHLEPAAATGIEPMPLRTPNAIDAPEQLFGVMTMVRKIVALFALTTSLALGACNTVEGVGEDVQSAGEAVEDAAD